MQDFKYNIESINESNNRGKKLVLVITTIDINKHHFVIHGHTPDLNESVHI